MVDNFGDEVKNLTRNDDTGERTTKADMDRAIAGLPVAGYKPTQPQAAIDAVNKFKELEERTLRHIEYLQEHQFDGWTADPRLLAIGRSQLQGAFMFLAHAVFQPGRVALPEDKIAESFGYNTQAADRDPNA